MTAIYRREMSSYFNNFTGYIFIVFMLLFTGLYCMGTNLNSGYANFEYTLHNMSFIFIIVIPVLTMRSLSEERRQKTDQLLYSLPTTMARVVWGKFLAMATVLSIPTLIMCIYPLLLSPYGNVNLLSAYGCIFAFFLLGCALIAMGLFISSLFELQSVTAGVCFVMMLLNYFMSSLAGYVGSSAFSSLVSLAILFLALGAVMWWLTKNFTISALVTLVCEILLMTGYLIKREAFNGLFPSAISAMCMFDRFTVFANSIFDLSGVVYYLVVIFVFAFLTIQSMEKRRWS